LKGVAGASHEKEGGGGGGRGREEAVKNASEVVVVGVREDKDEPPGAKFFINGFD